MDNSEIKHKYKKYKQYSKILFREIKEKTEDKNVNLALLTKLNGDLEKCILVMKSYLSLLDSKKEKKKIHKLEKFTAKTNVFINTRLADKDNAKLLDVVERINSKVMHDNKYLKQNNLSYKPNMFNSPFMPGTAMAYNGKTSIPVANPLGTAALGMANSLSLSLSDPVKDKADAILNMGPQSDDINVVSAMPMMIDPRASPEPTLGYPGPIVRHGKDTAMPYSISQPVMGPLPSMPFNSLANVFGPVGPMPSGLPMVAPGLGAYSTMAMAPVVSTPMAPMAPVMGLDIVGGKSPYGTKP